MTFSKSAFTKVFFCLAISCLLCGCYYTSTTQPMNLAFREDHILTGSKATNIPSFNNNIKGIVDCEKTEIQAVKIKTEIQVAKIINIRQATSTTVTATIINGKNIPTGNVQLKELGKNIAVQLKKSINNWEDFENYKVDFVTLDTTKNTSAFISVTYKKTEL